MSNVTVKQQLGMQVADFDDIASDFHIDSSDILIPKILLMQPSSEMVGDGEATIGDYRNSVTKEKVGSINEPFSFVPFHYIKYWSVVVKGEGNEFVRKEEWLPGDENKPWEFEEDGRILKRVKRLDFFGFDLKKLVSGDELPSILSFQSTGYREGTKILTQFKLNISKRKLPWSDVWAIAGEKKKNDNNQTYCVPKIDMIAETDEETLKICLDWYKNIKNKTKSIVVDESDVQSEYTADAMKDVGDTGNY
jgi:hypothetical protein